MNCQTTEELIQKSLDGELSCVERERLDAHLPGCAACRFAWEEQRRLAQIARRWVPRAAPTEMSVETFTAQVLARIAHQPVSAPARFPFWQPALAICLAVLSLALLPQALWPALPDFGSAVRALPGWLLANGLAVPADTLAVWAAAQHSSILPAWSWSLLAGAGLLNAVFYARALQSRPKGSLS